MIEILRLPFNFDPVKLKDDLSRVPVSEWTAHFNKSTYEGDWSGTALRAPVGAVHPIQKLNPNPGEKNYRDTELLESCTYFKFVLKSFKCPLRSVRLLKLKPGSVIKEHVDYFLAFEEGEARIHIPVMTNPGLHFYLNGKRVIMNEGETWYLNFNLKHTIENKGNTDRIHLVIDCEVNEWLIGAFNSHFTSTGIKE